MITYKLFRKRKDGTLGSLFINRKEIIPIGEWVGAEEYPTKGFKVRKGFHVTPTPTAPHLSTKGRVWAKVEIADFTELIKPEYQGGLWYIANKMRVIGEIK